MALDRLKELASAGADPRDFVPVLVALQDALVRGVEEAVRERIRSDLLNTACGARYRTLLAVAAGTSARHVFDTALKQLLLDENSDLSMGAFYALTMLEHDPAAPEDKKKGFWLTFCACAALTFWPDFERVLENRLAGLPDDYPLTGGSGPGRAPIELFYDRLIKSRNPEIVELAIRAMTRNADANFRLSILELLEPTPPLVSFAQSLARDLDEGVAVRRACINLLRDSAPETLPAILQGESDPEILSYLMRSILGVGESIDPGYQAIRSVLTQRNVPVECWASAGEALSIRGDRASLELLKEVFLQFDSAQISSSALSGLTRKKPEELAPLRMEILKCFLNSKSETARLDGARGIVKVAPELALTLLRPLAESDPSERVRAEVRKMLGL